MLKLFDTVTLKNDDPETGVKAGTEGTIVDVLGNGKAFTVEFFGFFQKLYRGLDMRILTCYNNIIHPGIAKLVSRLVWDQETVRSSRTTRTKMC